MRVTVADILKYPRCVGYGEVDVLNLFEGREYLTPQEIARLSIPEEDRLWALLRCCLSDSTRRRFVRDCIEAIAIKFCHPSPSTLPIVRTSKWYSQGKASNEDLVDSWVASLAFIRDAVRDSVWYVPGCTIWAATWASNMHFHVLSPATKAAYRNMQIGVALRYANSYE